MRFNDMGDAYAERLLAFSTKMGKRDLWPVIFQFPLYAEEQALARSITIADLLRSTVQVPGNIVEFGSWQGANVVYMAKLMRVFSPNSAKRTYCFESFEGLRRFAEEDGPAEGIFNRQYKGDRDRLDDVIALFDLQREIVIHAGDILETLPVVLAENPGLRFSFVYCDADLYEPTARILESVHDRLNVGGLFVFDEYGWDEFPGETLAVDEFIHDHPDEYEVLYLPNSRQPPLALRKSGR